MRVRAPRVDGRPHKSWPVVAVAVEVVTWIERTYHRRRRQAALGRLTPVEYALIMSTTAV